MKLALLTPPFSGVIVKRPASTARRARAASGETVMRGPARGFHAGDPGGDQPVGDDADEGDGKAGDDALAGIGLGQRLEHLLAEIAGADHGADDDHAERQQDRLVDAEHDLRQGDRQLDPPEQLQRVQPDSGPLR